MVKQLQSAIILTAICTLGNLNTAVGQVTNYNFFPSIGLYTEQTGGTILFQGDATNDVDDEFAIVTIPFTFNFNGTAYTSLYVNSNGSVSFGGGTSEYFFPLANPQDETAIASAFGTDLYSGDLPTSTITAQTTGTAPNRRVIIQWKNWLSLSASDSSNLNFQIRLNEAAGVAANQSIQFAYGSMYLDAFTDLEDVQVGLRGATITDYTNRSSFTGWATTLAGTDVEDYVESTSLLLPVSGQVFTYSINIPLAITLKDIAALNVGAANQISWSSEKEDEGDMYILERSADGKNFSALAEIKGKGIASMYSFSDNQPFAPVSYYRLRLSTTKGNATYSKIVSATMQSGDKNTLSIYPNPAKDFIIVNTENNAGSTVVIYNQLGNIAMKLNMPANQLRINIAILPKGVYYVALDNGTTTEKIKFIKD